MKQKIKDFFEWVYFSIVTIMIAISGLVFAFIFFYLVYFPITFPFTVLLILGIIILL
jgi:hypothetical protein